MKSKYIIALLKCKGIGNTKLFEYIKEQKFNFENIKKNINKLISLEDFINFDNLLNIAELEIKENEKHDIKIITILDKNYPSKLYTISDPILYLYYKGNIKLIESLSIAIIGTRHPSDNIKKTTFNIAAKLSSLNYTIISGLALGIDTIAHKGCLSVNGKTIAILPCSINNIFPTSNRDLAKEIINLGGCLITEYPVGSIINNFNYAKRNRIQSALSNVIIVPQADENSGTMITVKKSLKENKTVFQFSNNKNKLIKNSIDINSNEYIDNIKKAINNDLILEKIKNDKIKNSINDNKQISIFDI